MDGWGRDADGAGEGVILFDRRARQRSVKSVGWRVSRAVADARKPCSRAAEVTRANGSNARTTRNLFEEW
jgi:hypothetical protein